MSEEQLRILKMIEEKKITAEDGAKLLNALNEAATARDRGRQEGDRARRDAERARRDADRARQEGERARREGRRGGWGFPEPPIPPIPPIPPLPPFDPFEAAFSQGRDRDRRRGRRDTEPLDAETRPGGQGRFFRIRVSDPKSNNTMVNINLPLGLINFGLKVASRYIPEDSDIDLETITQAVQQGAIGKIIDIHEGTPENPGAHVEITID